MYLKHWNLKTHPFSNIPDPSVYFSTEEDDPVSDILEEIDQNSRRLIILTGSDGSGKTTCMRTAVERLDHTQYSIAFVTNPAEAFPPLLREIVGQLQHRILGTQTLGYFVREFHDAVNAAGKQGRRVLVFVDDYAATSMPDLASLHSLLTEQGSTSSRATFVLAGGNAFATRLHEPACEELFAERSRTVTTTVISSPEALRSYIQHRLEAAGAAGPCPFTSEALTEIWMRPENRIARKLNSVCRVCLKRGAEAEAREIGHDLARDVCTSLSAHPLTSLPAHSSDIGGIPRRNPSIANRNDPKPAQSMPLYVDEAKERLASQLAADRIRHLDGVRDPFEAWSSARDEILTALRNARLHRAVS